MSTRASAPLRSGRAPSDQLGLGGRSRDVGWLQLRNPEGGISLNIQAEEAYEPPVWPERPGHQAKMMHFEVLVNDLDAAVRLVLEWGGNEAPHQPADRDRTRLRIMLDTAGHPFCLFVDGE